MKKTNYRKELEKQFKQPETVTTIKLEPTLYNFLSYGEKSEFAKQEALARKKLNKGNALVKSNTFGTADGKKIQVLAPKRLLGEEEGTVKAEEITIE